MADQGFHFVEISGITRSLRDDLLREIANSGDEKIKVLGADLPSELGKYFGEGLPPLSLAFVGQYNAGKSTLISALTGRADIPIDGDVCTDKVTAFNWNGIRLLDTPGIHAGYPDHDLTTYEAIDSADLLVFVITNELFDDLIGQHFRELAFSRNKAREMMLVVNKMGQDSGTPDIKSPDIEKVTSPLRYVDFRTVFVDALSFLDAAKAEDEEERKEYLCIARMEDLVGALNKFVQERGLMGRLTTPLFILRSLAQQAAAYASVDMPEERAALELLNRKRGLFLNSRARLRGTLLSLITKAVGDIVAYGDMVAEKIEPGATEDGLKLEQDRACKQAEMRYELLQEEVATATEKELEDLERELGVLRNGVLASRLVQRGHDNANTIRILPPGDTSARGPIPSDWIPRMGRASRVAGEIGNFASKWATGPAVEGGARIGSTLASSGSKAHYTVYNVGKFFGVKFKPWGAVKAARIIGNVGRVITAIGGILAIVAQIAEDKGQEEYRIQLRDARDEARTTYRDSARDIESQVWNQFERFGREFYDEEITDIDRTVFEISEQNKQRGKEAQTFASIVTCATEIIEKAQGDFGIVSPEDIA